MENLNDNYSRPKVSVIIPAYNREDVIGRSIWSVLNQTYNDLECIVVDDCSSDNTKCAVNAINDKRLKYHRLEQNSGACVARNIGIKLAMGEFIAFQDSDDEWVPNKLELQLDAIKKSGADVCFCKKHITSVSGDFSYDTLPKYHEGIIPNKILYNGSMVSTQTILAKREVCDEINFDVNVKKGQDYEWTLRASEYYKFYLIAQPLVNQYLQKNSITVLGERDLSIRLEMNEYYYSKFSEKFKSNPDLEIALFRRVLVSRLLCGKAVSADYWHLYKLTKSKRDLFKLVAYQFGITKLRQKIRHKNVRKSTM